jgi:tetratricopeptide (TPR) repeat protein
MDKDPAKDSAAVLLTAELSHDFATVDGSVGDRAADAAPAALDGSANALHERGVRFINEGKPLEAIPLLKRAVELKPDSADFHHNLGVALAHRGKLDEAVAEFRAALRIKPTGASALSNMGLALSQQGMVDEAIAALQDCLRLQPGSVDVLHRLANVLRNARRPAEALPHIQEAVRIKLDSAELQHTLGLTCADLEKSNDAIAAYREALRLNPKYPDALNNLGIILQNTGKSQEAVDCYRRALRLRPHSSETYNNLGVALAALERHDDAIMAYRAALQLYPDSAAAHSNLGNAFRQVGLVDDAVASLNRALELNPQYGEGFNNKAVALMQAGQPAEAVECYDRALELKPDYPDAYLNRALARLLVNDYGGGLEDYEWRWRRPNRGMPNWGRPVWDGQDPVGRVILLWGEQGLGDSLQFSRFAAVLAARGAVPILCVPELLVRLLRTIPGVHKVESSSDKLPPFACHAPLMSMMKLTGMKSLDEAPARVPYVSADAVLAAAVRERVRAGADLVVGVVWRGNPQYAGDKIRSVGPELIAPLAKIDGVRLVSLMKEVSEQERTAAGAADIGATAWADFAEAAASFVNLDLVISVDTAAAHLAGALGVPVWIALPSAPDMRWGLARGDSPWYPTARLFRQEQRAEWERVFARITEELGIIVRRDLRPAQTVGKASVAEALHQRGLALLGERRVEEGAAYLQDAVRLAPDSAAMRLNLGVGLAQLRRLDDAIREFGKAVELDPNSALGHANLGLAYVQAARHREASAVLEIAARLDPKSADVHNHLGIALASIGREDDAAKCYERALEVRRYHAPLTNLGNLRRAQGRLEESLGYYDEAIRLFPADPDIYNNRGITLEAMQANKQAMDDYERALALSPDHAETRFNRALALLLEGDYARGLEEYEWRWRRPGQSMTDWKAPLWDGSIVPGKTLLVWSEQGLGDVIHCCRFAPLLAERGLRVFVHAPAALVPLLQTLGGVDRVIGPGEAVPPIDAHAPVMSLPRLWGMQRLDDAPAPIPYLTADATAAIACRDRVRAGAEFVVGIAWRGNPDYAGDRARSAPPRSFACLSRVPGVRVVSVMKDASREECAAAGAADIGAAAWPDFAAAAAAFANLDLLICVDTAASHLAGALGIPVWIALPAAPDWRWALDRDDTPWYPTARLFRQEWRDDWQPVLERIAESLATRCSAATG